MKVLSVERDVTRGGTIIHLFVADEQIRRMTPERLRSGLGKAAREWRDGSKERVMDHLQQGLDAAHQVHVDMALEVLGLTDQEGGDPNGASIEHARRETVLPASKAG